MRKDGSPSERSPEVVRRGAVAVIVRQPRLLVIRRSQQVLAPGRLCFPGGGLEAGESEPQALVRELREELGVTVQPVRRVWECVTRWRVSLAWWLSVLDEGAALRPDPAEVAAVHWYTPAELVDRDDLLDSNREFLLAVQSGQVALD
jgi:8-oxo-dGTP pyrophosphatase MutT (NUDIX family)